jgi:hypothetical protein
VALLRIGVLSIQPKKDTSRDEPARSQRDAASVVFNLPGYDIIEAVDPATGRPPRGRASHRS